MCSFHDMRIYHSVMHHTNLVFSILFLSTSGAYQKLQFSTSICLSKHPQQSSCHFSLEVIMHLIPFLPFSLLILLVQLAGAAHGMAPSEVQNAVSMSINRPSSSSSHQIELEVKPSINIHQIKKLRTHFSTTFHSTTTPSSTDEVMRATFSIFAIPMSPSATLIPDTRPLIRGQIHKDPCGPLHQNSKPPTIHVPGLSHTVPSKLPTAPYA